MKSRNITCARCGQTFVFIMDTRVHYHSDPPNITTRNFPNDQLVICHGTIATPYGLMYILNFPSIEHVIPCHPSRLLGQDEVSILTKHRYKEKRVKETPYGFKEVVTEYHICEVYSNELQVELPSISYTVAHERFPMLEESRLEEGDILESFPQCLYTIHDAEYHGTFTVEIYSNLSIQVYSKVLFRDNDTGVRYRIKDVGPYTSVQSLLEILGINSAILLSAEANEAYHEGRMNPLDSNDRDQQRMHLLRLITLGRTRSHFYAYTEEYLAQTALPLGM